MSLLSGSVLVESKSARDNQLEQVSDERALEILNKVKALYFALWQGTGTTTTELVAAFFEVSDDTIRSVLKRHKQEMGSDGVKELRGKDLQSLQAIGHCIVQLPEATTRVTLWTPRATLRLGMLLRDSEVAKTVRTTLLDAVAAIPIQVERIRELELELAIAKAQGETAKAQEQLAAVTQAIATLHGTEMVALILGKPDAVLTPTERVETLVPVDAQGRALAQYDGVGITYLANRYGFGKKTQACREWLKTIGVTDEQWLEEPSLVKTQKLARDLVAWLDRQYATRQGNRQQLIGE